MAIRVTKAVLDAVAGKDTGQRGVDLAAAMTKHFPTYSINTPLRVAHFLAQAAHETMGFRHLRELGNGDKNGDGLDDYLIYLDDRTDLGNTPQIDGDGQRYRGRGLFHLTGTANYKKYGDLLGVDLLARPELVEQPEYAAQTACLYWNSKNLSSYADKDDIRKITYRVNGGYNGYNDRVAKLARAKRAMGLPG